jgi:TonB family protein
MSTSSDQQLQEAPEQELWLGRDQTERRVLSRSLGAALALHATILAALLVGFARTPARVEAKKSQPIRVHLMRPAPPAKASAPRVDETPLTRVPRTDPTIPAVESLTVTVGPPSLSYTSPEALPGVVEGPAPQEGAGIGGIGPVRISAGQAPGLIRRVEPQYPAVARTARIQGTVIVDAVIRMNGTVSDVTILRSSNPMFNQPCVDAVRQWRFTPIPQDVILTVTVNFTLR